MISHDFDEVSHFQAIVEMRDTTIRRYLAATSSGARNKDWSAKRETTALAHAENSRTLFQGEALLTIELI